MFDYRTSCKQPTETDSAWEGWLEMQGNQDCRSTHWQVKQSWCGKVINALSNHAVMENSHQLERVTRFTHQGSNITYRMETELNKFMHDLRKQTMHCYTKKWGYRPRIKCSGRPALWIRVCWKSRNTISDAITRLDTSTGPQDPLAAVIQMYMKYGVGWITLYKKPSSSLQLT